MDAAVNEYIKEKEEKEKYANLFDDAPMFDDENVGEKPRKTKANKLENNNNSNGCTIQ